MYNPYTGGILEYHGNIALLRLIKKLLSLKNLRVIRLKQSEVNNPMVKELIEDVRKHFMGDLINVVDSKGKPMQMPPIVKIQRDVKYYAHYLNIVRKSSIVTKIAGDNALINVLVTHPLDKKKLLGAIEAFGAINSKYCFTFIVENEDDFMNSQEIINTFSIGKVEFKAFYNGDNLRFFKENIYIDRQDIEKNKPSLNDIYTRESVNSLAFGSLTIFPNRRIYANVNAPSLGILKRDSIYEVLIKEMSHNRSWRKIRKNVLPCKSCTFESLCPPLSNYNEVIKRNNLCHIKQEK